MVAAGLGRPAARTRRGRLAGLRSRQDLSVGGRGAAWLELWPPQQETWLPALGPFPAAPLVEVSWEPRAGRAGFEIRRISVSGRGLWYLAVAPDLSLPAFQAFGRLVDAETAASAEAAGAAELARLSQALSALPVWDRALFTGAGLAERIQDYSAAAAFLERLINFQPAEPQLWRRYAVAVSESAAPASAEPVLRRAVEILPKDAELWERLARARVSQGDAAEGYKFLRRSLEIDPERVPLWWRAADLARQLGDLDGERQALGEGLRRQRDPLPRWIRYIELLIGSGESREARDALLESEALVPQEAAPLTRYAQFWEVVGEAPRALEFWRRAIRADPDLEAGYLGVARLEGAAWNWKSSLEAATQGLERAPRSVGLRLARAEALLALDLHQEARSAIRAAAELGDLALLRLQARIEDLFGGEQAARAWSRYLEALTQQGEPQELEAARRQAIFSALRDGRPEAAAELLGLPEQESPSVSTDQENTAVIPGGVSLLRNLSGVPGPSEPEQYLVSFARAAVELAGTQGSEEWARRADLLLEHYERLNELRRLGQPVPGATVVTIQLGSRQDDRRSRRVLELLGYRLRRSGGTAQVEMPARGEMSRRQSLAAALELDEEAMAEAVRENRTFTIAIRDDRARVVLGAKVWGELLADRENALGFTGMLAKDLKAARLFAGLSSVGSRAAEALARRFGIRRLADDYADLLYLYGSALTIDEAGRCATPGGEAAEAIWQALAGVSPRQGARFVETLLRKRDGALLAFFSQLHATTPERQAWFLRSAERARRFYELVRTSSGWGSDVERRRVKNPLAELIRDLPLDSEGRVRFPGAPEVWQVTRGASDLSRLARLARRAARARPAEEEAIIERLARERYEARGGHSQLENFLAVAHIERAFARDLTPREALILAEQFPRSPWAVPFLTALPGLGETELLAFFSWLRLTPEDTLEANLALGLWENVVLLEGLLRRSGRLSDAASAAIFRQLCDESRLADDRAARAAAAVKALRAVAAELKAAPGTFQEAIEDALLGPAESLLGRRRREELHEVLRLQKLPPIDSILDLYAAAEAARDPAQARQSAERIGKSVPSLQELEPAREIDSAEDKMRDYLRLRRTEELVRLARELERRASRRRQNPADFERISRNLCGALAPWLELGLRGLVLGLYFRPSDLVISEDPLFLRKYCYRDFSEVIKETFPLPDVYFDRKGVGAIPKGSLAGLWILAGRVAALSDPSTNAAARHIEGLQLGAIRNAFLWRLTGTDLRLVRLSVLAGREWVAEAAFSADEARALARAWEGLLSAERRSVLEETLSRLRAAHASAATAPLSRSAYAGLWKTVWENLSMSDLYWCGRLRQQGTARSAAWRHLGRLASTAASSRAIDELGIVPFFHSYSFVPRLFPLPPYEDYVRYLRLEYLGERLTEFLLSLASAVDEAGLPPESAALLAEPVLRRLLKRLEMADPWDYSAVVTAWKALAAGDVATAWTEYVNRTP